MAKNLIIHDVPIAMIERLRILAKQRNESVESFVRELLEAHLERASVHEQIESSWGQQVRRPRAREIDAWIQRGRE